MTIKQMQCLLTYLGYDPGVIDGVDGPNTQKALADFTADYGVGVDGLAGAVGGTVPRLAGLEKKDWWQDIKYFKREEFRCKCGGKYCNGFPAEPQEKLVRLADKVRSHFGAAAVVSSGLRCEKHNAKVGGKSGSRHRTGCAMDFCVKGVSGAKLDAYIGSLKGVNFHYVIDGGYCHMDVVI